MKKLPKFFCEYCGSEVRQNDRVCPHCGRFFASVKCPSCGFAGESKQFKSGCPQCGYAFHPDSSAPVTQHKQKNKNRANSAATDPLPWWVYLVSLGMLAGVVTLILMNAA